MKSSLLTCDTQHSRIRSRNIPKNIHIEWNIFQSVVHLFVLFSIQSCENVFETISNNNWKLSIKRYDDWVRMIGENLIELTINYWK